jgi:hypothetical protein
LARMAVKPAKNADSSAQINQLIKGSLLAGFYKCDESVAGLRGAGLADAGKNLVILSEAIFFLVLALVGKTHRLKAVPLERGDDYICVGVFARRCTYQHGVYP